jgi:hypothetical protein
VALLERSRALVHPALCWNAACGCLLEPPFTLCSEYAAIVPQET